MVKFFFSYKWFLFHIKSKQKYQFLFLILNLISNFFIHRQKKFTHIKSTTIFRFLWLNYTNFYNFYKNSNFHLYSRNRCLCLSSHALAVTFSTYITWRKSLCQFPSKERVFFPTSYYFFLSRCLSSCSYADERGTLFTRL